MAKAVAKSITQSHAMALAREYLGNPKFVEREILKGLAAGEIPWRCVRFETSPHYSGPGPGDPKFWEFDPNQLIYNEGPVLALNVRGIALEGDSARRIDGAAAYGIEFDRGALVRLKLLPAGAGAKGVVTKDWITAEVKNMKADGEILPDIKISDFARELEQRMEKAVRVGTVKKSVGWKYIKDCLPRWDLWPISSIK